MKVLLTGASGFLGRYVLESLQSHGIDTVTVTRRQSDIPYGDFIQADLLTTQDFHLLVEKAAASHLLHLGWYAEHGIYWTSPLNLRWVDATMRLVEAFCDGGGESVVMAGTCAEYDWSYGLCREETTPVNPATLYGTAKDATRRLAASLCALRGVSFASGRIFFPYGKGEAAQRLIPSLIQVFQKKRQPFGVNATAYRDLLHASDLAEGFVTLLRSGANGTYNICSGEPVCIEKIVIELAQLLQADPQQVLDLATARPGEPRILFGDNLKLKALGWSPTLSLAKGFEKTVHQTP